LTIYRALIRERSVVALLSLGEKTLPQDLHAPHRMIINLRTSRTGSILNLDVCDALARRPGIPRAYGLAMQLIDRVSCYALSCMSLSTARRSGDLTWHLKELNLGAVCQANQCSKEVIVIAVTLTSKARRRIWVSTRRILVSRASVWVICLITIPAHW
jgi:hypothetical protein